MQKYIYGNVGHKGFAYVSSDKDFFFDEKSGKRRVALQPLQRYDKTEGQSYWMVTTDLGIPGEEERIFVQVSGADPHRDGIYMQGYMTDPGEALFGPELLRLLRVRFQNLGNAMAEAEGGVVKASRPEDLPMDDSLRPAETDANLMQNILLSLLGGRRVILRLPESGAAAVRSARELLLDIYQRLPYECRRLNGFLTGTSQSVIFDWENPLPPSITIVMLDGDADVSELSTDRYQLFIDLADGRGSIEPIDRNRNAAHLKLLDFLAGQPVEVLDEFFRLCKDFSDAETDGGGLKLSEYSLLLDMFNIGRGEITAPRLRMWAASLYKNKWSESTNEIFYKRVAQAIPPKKMQAYLTNSVTIFEDLNALGVLGEEDRRHTSFYGSGLEEIRDLNEALTLNLTEMLLARGEYPREAGAEITSALSSRFLELAHGKYPCLMEEKPTAATLSQLEQLNFPSEEHVAANLPIFKEVRYTVYQKLREETAAVKTCYHQQYAAQYQTGIQLINQWPAPGAECWNLEDLYCQLQTAYLWDELFHCREQQSWSQRIAERIAEVCICGMPRTLENIQLALERTNRSIACFLDKGGQFTEAQEKKLQENTEAWKNILALAESNCSSMEEMLNLFDRVEAAELEADAAARLRKKYVEHLISQRPVANDIFRAVPALLQRCKEYPQEKEAFRAVIAASAGLNVIPGDMPLEQIKPRLKCIQLLADAELADSTVRFDAWKKKGPAKALLARIDAMETFLEGKLEPEFPDAPMRSWAAKHLQANTSLMFLLAKKYPSMREELIELLAQKPEAVDAGQIRELYVAGCSKKLLCRSAGERTSIAWQQAADSAFPSWFSLADAGLEEAEPQPNLASGILSVAAPVLLGLAGIVPSVAMGLVGGIPAIAYGAAMLVLVVAEIACIASTLLVWEKEQKQLMRWLTLSQLPGILTLLVQLIFALML